MKDTLIILGAGVMQGPAIQIAKSLGFFTIVLDGSGSAPCISMADRFEQIDLKDKEGIEAFARSVRKNSDRLGIVTAGTDFSASVAWVSEKLGLPGIPYETALNASDKSRMRECFKKANLPSPDFFTVSASDAGLSLNEALYPFPLVIKPVDNMGSRGCRRVDNIKEFEQAAKSAIGFSRSGRAIAEKYMDGPEFSVDAIVHHGEITICGLADRHIFFPPYFIEMGHTMPTVIGKEKQNALLDTFRAGIRALCLDAKENTGAAKGDIKLTSNGPMIGEIAARLSGGYMSGWTYPYSSGALPVKAAILAAMGFEPDGLVQNKKWTCAERAFISIPGTVRQIVINNDDLTIDNKKLPENVNNFFMRIEEGSKVSFPENNVTKCGNIIASAGERETAVFAAENAARSVLIRLNPNDTQTAAFLETKTNFPPDAFNITDALRNELNNLPDAPHSPLNILHSTFIIHPFPAFQSSGLRDYMGRTVQETLDAVRKITGFSLPVSAENAENIETPQNAVMLGRSFWAALIRGSYQGAAYYIDSPGAK